jgi:hypothetical protein
MRYTLSAITLAALLLSLTTSIVVAQNQPLKCEVASVRPNLPSDPNGNATLGVSHGGDSKMPNFPSDVPIKIRLPQT